MKNGIDDEVYYYLLDWKDRNMKHYLSMYPNKALNDLSVQELHNLYISIKNNEDYYSLLDYHEEVNRIIDQELSIPALNNTDRDMIDMEYGYAELHRKQKEMMEDGMYCYPSWLLKMYL